MSWLRLIAVNAPVIVRSGHLKIDGNAVNYPGLSIYLNSMENDMNPYQALRKFVGKWNAEGVICDRKSGYEVKVSGVDTYEWLPGGYFLLHKAY